MSPFNINLRAAREKAGLTRQELADIVGISVSALGQYEQGRREPDLQKLIALAAGLYVSVDELLGYHVDEYLHYATMVSKAFNASSKQDASQGLIFVDHLNAKSIVFSFETPDMTPSKQTLLKKAIELISPFVSVLDLTISKEQFLKIVNTAKHRSSEKYKNMIMREIREQILYYFINDLLKKPDKADSPHADQTKEKTADPKKADGDEID